MKVIFNLIPKSSLLKRCFNNLVQGLLISYTFTFVSKGDISVNRLCECDWWENAATGKEKANAAAYLHLTPCKPTAKEVAAVKPDAARIALLRAALGSVADRAIIPMSAWLGLGAEAHLNTPGKLGGNWTWRAAEGFDAEPLASRIQAECEGYCRAKEPVEKEEKTSN